MEKTHHTTDVVVEWGDCDEAGIVFYPNYFYWFDCAYHRLLRTKGLNQKTLRARYGAVTPLVESNAKFTAPASYDDVISITATVDEWAEKRFRMTYSIAKSGILIAEGFEVRAWALLLPDGTLKGAQIDRDFKRLLAGQEI
jgi:YbgC/YbaW family acyl-CoA thioester hydrolase